MIFCICNNVTETLLNSMAIELSGDPERLAEALGLYTERCCGRCADDLRERLPLLTRTTTRGE